MKKKFVLFILVLSLASFMGLKIYSDKIPRKKIPGSSIIYIPSGKHLKLATLGCSSVLADLVYLWAIQYYSDFSIADRYKNLDHIFSVISELDPHYLDPYEVGALIAVYEAGDPLLGLKVLDRGLEKNPNQWIFPFQAGHYAQMVMKDFKLAQKYYQKAMKIEGAPAVARRLYAYSAFKLADYETSWKTWLEIYREAEEERIKKIASNHLYQVKAAMDIRRINQAIEEFRKRYRHNPSDLSRLVETGLLESLPQDLDGQDYLYDQETGKTEPRSIPWKR
ncbi:MAG: tetratricopeptide repeat protein [Candidatus Aminicenantes bacterium]